MLCTNFTDQLRLFCVLKMDDMMVFCFVVKSVSVKMEVNQTTIRNACHFVTINSTTSSLIANLCKDRSLCEDN